MRQHSFTGLVVGRIGLVALIVAASTTQTWALDLVKPSKTFEEERQEALAQHREVLDEFGGEYQNERVSGYVDRVGRKVVAHSDMPDRPFEFTVLNTPIVNAFTVGGGIVYVTRGALAAMNTEAELAALLGHEVGHVTGRDPRPWPHCYAHSASPRQSVRRRGRATLARRRPRPTGWVSKPWSAPDTTHTPWPTCSECSSGRQSSLRR